MSLRSGINSQLAIATEGTWASGATVTRFLPHVGESIKQDIARMESKGIIAGRRVLDSSGRVAGDVTVSGQVQLELYDHGEGLWWSHILGGATISGAGPYTQTYTPGDLSSKSFTTQVGRPDSSGTVQAFTYTGCKVNKWQLQCQTGQIATLNVDISAKAESTAVSLASASYTSTLVPLTYISGALTGVSGNVKQVTLNGDNKLNDKRRFLNSGAISEQFEADLRDYSGTLATEFTSLVDYQKYTGSGVTNALVLTFTAGSNTLTITLNVEFDGETPHVNGRGIIDQPLKFKCIGTTDAAAITVVTVNSDAAA
jgi:hypothetical protein